MPKTKAEIIEELELLATFFTLAKTSAEYQEKTAKEKGNDKMASVCMGRKIAFGVAFAKVDGILRKIKGR